MSDHAITLRNLADPISPEMNLYFFFKEVVDQVSGAQMEILEFLVAAGTSRGWFPELSQIAERFAGSAPAEEVSAAIETLQHLRLLTVSDEGKILRIVGGVTHQKTALRAMTEDNVAFNLVSSLDALTIAPMLQKQVVIKTKCAMSSEAISFTVSAAGDLVETSPNELTAFVPGWDGEAPIAETMTEGHFFKDDDHLNRWQSERDYPDGMPLTQDTIRSVGMEMAVALAALYVRMSIR